MSFDRDFEWQARHLHHVKQVILDQLPRLARISEASFEDDATRNTDLVLKIDATRIAVRLRRAKDIRYADEFTLRSYRPSGVVTELTKVVSGWGDYNFYGFVGDRGLIAWLLGDLSVFRLWHQRQLWGSDQRVMPGVEIPNPDGTKFRAYRIDDLPDEFVIARERPQELSGAA